MGAASLSTVVAAEVLAAERRRAAAVIARDLGALAPCLHDELVYVHATGVRHDKAGVLKFIADGPQFLVVDVRAGEPAAVGVADDAVLLHGQLHLHLRRPGEVDAVHAVSWASGLWVRDASQGGTGRWQLRLFQSTRVAA